MMTVDEIELEARLYALEYMFSTVNAAFHLQTGNAAASVISLRKSLREKIRTLPVVKGADPAESDLFSAAVEDALERLVRMQASLLGVTLPPDEE